MVKARYIPFSYLAKMGRRRAIFAQRFSHEFDGEEVGTGIHAETPGGAVRDDDWVNLRKVRLAALAFRSKTS